MWMGLNELILYLVFSPSFCPKRILVRVYEKSNYEHIALFKLRYYNNVV